MSDLLHNVTLYDGAGEGLHLASKLLVLTPFLLHSFLLLSKSVNLFLNCNLSVRSKGSLCCSGEILNQCSLLYMK